MKLKCPSCGATGTDVRPPADGVTGPSDEPVHLKGQEDYAFEVRGNYGGRPVRKCLNCGSGVRVSFLPPRFRKVPEEEWAYLQDRWAEFKAESEAYYRELDEQRAAMRESSEERDSRELDPKSY